MGNNNSINPKCTLSNLLPVGGLSKKLFRVGNRERVEEVTKIGV